MTTPQKAAGAHTLSGILSQPQCWQDCFRSLETDGQLMGFYTGLRKGYDPDSPRHLSRVVVLKDNE